MSNKIVTEMKTVEIGGQEFALSYMLYEDLEFVKDDVIDLSDALAATLSAYETVATAFKSSQYSQHQKSACLVIDYSPIADKLSDTVLFEMAKNAGEDVILSQNHLYSMFECPVFQVQIFPNVDANLVQEATLEINPSGNVPYVCGSFEDAMKQSIDLLKMAHRL